MVILAVEALRQAVSSTFVLLFLVRILYFCTSHPVELIQARTHVTFVFHLHTELHTLQSWSFLHWKRFVIGRQFHICSALFG